MNKTSMKNCKVFYVNVREIPSEYALDIVGNFIKNIEKTFDTSDIIFVPTREKETGWQIDKEIVMELIDELKSSIGQNEKFLKVTECPDCSGTKKYQGLYLSESCKTCDGQGQVAISKL